MKLEELEDLWFKAFGSERSHIALIHFRQLLDIAKAAQNLKAVGFRECVYDTDEEYEKFFEAEKELDKALLQLEGE